ncbi:unnamed protein product [Heterosigma akashiwo]|mmetsp:Transcript_1242/g.1887  ORF Transcript_1242/g.1887 Transcript_1242/m.1887 type:complete len:209 (-) Transcript_1242:415-1041(-)
MDYDELYKIILVGDSSVGKTNLLNQYVQREVRDQPNQFFDQAQRPTIGVEFGTNTVVHSDGTRIKAQIWDTAGQERYRSITSSHYRRAAAALLVYDVTNPASLDNITKYWHNEVKKASEAGSTLVDCFMLIGNKTDLSAKVSKSQHDAAASSLNIKYAARTSAKTGDGVKQAFDELVLAIYEHDQNKGKNRPMGNIKLNTQEKKSGCC